MSGLPDEIAQPLGSLRDEEKILAALRISVRKLINALSAFWQKRAGEYS